MIQQKTGTNIYFPTALCGVFNSPGSGQDTGSSSPSSRDTPIPPTGEHTPGQMTSHNGNGHGLPQDQFAYGNHQNHGPVYPPYTPGPYMPHNIHPQHGRPPPYMHYQPAPMNGIQPGSMAGNHPGMMNHPPNGGFRGGRRGGPPGAMRGPSANMHPGFNGQPPARYQGYGPGMYDGQNMNMAPYHGGAYMHVGMPGGMIGAPGHQPAHGADMLPVGQYSPSGADIDVYKGEQGDTVSAMEVWITGEFFGVQRAYDLLLERANAKRNSAIHRSMVIQPRKNDWLLTEHLSELRTIMIENGTYIQMPPIGCSSTTIVVYGDHPVPIIRTLRQISMLTCRYSEATVSLLPIAFDPVMPAAGLTPSHMEPLLKSISHSTGVEIVLKSNVLEVHGLDSEVVEAVRLILGIDIVNSYNAQVEFKLELGSQHQVFVEGKKRGKLNRITRSTGVNFDQFTRVTDFTQQLRVSGDGASILTAMTELEREFPAEVSFFVPDKDHRRIIGQTGSNLKQIMERYNVYIRFLDRQELDSEGGLANTEDNCVIRTPAKLADNLELAKADVNSQCVNVSDGLLLESTRIDTNIQDNNFAYERVKIPRHFHRNLVSEQAAFIENIQRNTSSVIRFPPKELGSDVVTIFGPEKQIQTAVAWLQELVPFEAELAMPFSTELAALATSEDFAAFAKRIKGELQIDILPPLTGKHPKEGSMIFKLACVHSSVDLITDARRRLEEFIQSRGIQVHSADTEAFSFIDSFGYFQNPAKGSKPTERPPKPPVTQDAKALFENAGGSGMRHASVGSVGDGQPTAQLSQPRESFGAPKGPNVSHAPNAAPGLHTRHSGYFGHNGNGVAPPLPFGHPVPPNQWGSVAGFSRGRFQGGPGFVGAPPSSYQDFSAPYPRAVAPPSDYAKPLTLNDPSNLWTPAPLPSVASPVSSLPPSHDTPPGPSESSKRESDPLLADKARQAQSHAARISARTQSLDITSLNFKRALTGSGSVGGNGSYSGAPRPPSPGVGSSPNTASAAYFPTTHRVRGMPRANSSSYDAKIDGLAQGEQFAGYSLVSVTDFRSRKCPVQPPSVVSFFLINSLHLPQTSIHILSSHHTSFVHFASATNLTEHRTTSHFTTTLLLRMIHL